ncbi:Panacea domain-containing protein [Brevibacillus laterosporus]|uniref:Panacea domain-containing protein n=1 Tax=Brevibacillus laterosporus TaxID=1465 RepID=UPI0018CEA76C|nr:type II toxin-antitoxin system antitoxin SocA domain-containing protein [Brevibacillus laterosporus]MBG9788869.1 hypothetical protein [Brevibacillus laterosporus]
MPNVFEVAKYFLSKSELNTERAITHLKLQKLVYYAQAWYYTIEKKKPLFQERIEAWVHGPVCPDLYSKYREYGFEVIDPSNEESQTNFDPKTKSILDFVWDLYGCRDGKELEELTHQEEPWKIARGHLDDSQSSNNEISLDDMNKYYSKFLT